jgi:hypothetical protein
MVSGRAVCAMPACGKFKNMHRIFCMPLPSDREYSFVADLILAGIAHA